MRRCNSDLLTARGEPSAVLLEKHSELDPEDLGDLPHIQNCDIPFAALNGADEGAMQIALIGELLLGETVNFPLSADLVPQSLQKLLVVDARHVDEHPAAHHDAFK